MKHSIEISEVIQYQCGAPVECYAAWSNDPAAQDRLLLVDFDLDAYWLEGAPKISLTAIYLESERTSYISVTDKPLVGLGLAPSDQYFRWSFDHQMVRYSSGLPIRLSPLAVPKPWGQEIWYTGVEARGVCCFFQGELNTPIPWLQAVIPGRGLGDASDALVLLKILDPSAEPVVGDLYFELHEEKQEVYVVTHVDKASWPDGVGYIRMGFDPQKLGGFGGDVPAFKKAYLSTVQDYEEVRREIDKQSKSSEIQPEQLQRENELRSRMDSYSLLVPLAVGDVVKVPLLTPHSLQHGVRTVEFQTPVYERKILSFAQQVITQNHWDTKEAVDIMVLEIPPGNDFTVLEDTAGQLIERIVDFSDFEVRRVSLSNATSMTLAPLPSYALIMVVEGELMLENLELVAEEALILPSGWSGKLTFAEPESSGVLLLATPRH